MHQYSTLIGKHLGIDYKFTSGESVVISIGDVVFSKDIVLKLKNFRHVYDDSKPMVRSLMAHYKMEGICTVFKTDDSWSILLGNQKLIYPSMEGKTHLVLTSYFVKDPKILENMTKVSFHENCYSYKNTVLFLDNYMTPHAGSSYFKSTPDEYFRICYITLQNDFSLNFDNVNGIFKFPLKTKPATATVSPFIQNVSMEDVLFSDKYYESTNIVLKNHCFTDPDLILHDILDSYPSTNELGIVIEYPILISSGSHKKFNAFAINCNAPKEVLYVPAPYDRYYQYRYPPKHIKWTTLYHGEEDTHEMLPVVVSKNVIGYVYKNTFFCLLHPKLTLEKQNKNTEYLLNMLSFDIHTDPNFKVVQTYRFDYNHTLLCVKHKLLFQELWCMKLDNRSTTYSKAIVPSYLVREWGELMLENGTHYDVSFIKLMHKLDQHNICYSTKETSGERRIEYKNQTDIVFHLEPNVLTFINGLRQHVPTTTNEEGCVIS